MKEPTRLFAEGGSLAEAVAGLRAEAPDASRLEHIAEGLAAQGVQIDPTVKAELGLEPTNASPPPSGDPSELADGLGQGGWVTSAKVGLGVVGVVALGLVGGLLAEEPLSRWSRGESESAPAASTLESSGSRSVSEPGALGPNAAARSGAPAAPRSDVAQVDTPHGPAPSDPVVGPSEGADAVEEPAEARREVVAAAPEREERPRATGVVGVAPKTQRVDATPSSEPSLVSTETETSLLKRAREALAKNPGTSLALADEHQRTYPRGRLGQEREVIAITALVRLGRPTAARERAVAFNRAYPRSAYATQIERVVASE